MVDKVQEVVEKTRGDIVGRVCRAVKNVTGNEMFFEGHFPDHPVFPGVLMIEAIAQTGALCCSAAPGDPAIKTLFLAGLNNVKFKNPVQPGDVLDIRVEMKRKKGDFYWGEGLVQTAGKTACQADITAHIVFQKHS